MNQQNRFNGSELLEIVGSRFRARKSFPDRLQNSSDRPTGELEAGLRIDVTHALRDLNYHTTEMVAEYSEEKYDLHVHPNIYFEFKLATEVRSNRTQTLGQVLDDLLLLKEADGRAYFLCLFDESYRQSFEETYDLPFFEDCSRTVTLQKTSTSGSPVSEGLQQSCLKQINDERSGSDAIRLDFSPLHRINGINDRQDLCYDIVLTEVS